MRGYKYHLKQAFIGPLKWRFAGRPLLAQKFECWLGSFAIFQGILTSIVKELYSFNFCDFPGGSRPAVPHPPGSAHVITSFLPFGVSPFNSACWVIFHIFCYLLIFFQNYFFKKFFQKYIRVSNSLSSLIWVPSVCKDTAAAKIEREQCKCGLRTEGKF